MTDESLIHLRVQAALKARWIRASRAAGMRLTDWIIQQVTVSMMTKITIPEHVRFADLQLTRDPITGDSEFNWDPLEIICEASNLDIDMFRHGPEDNVAGLITAWYQAHRAAGGEPDPVQEQLIAEVMAESVAGGEAGVMRGSGSPQ